mgnify:FL=1
MIFSSIVLGSAALIRPKLWTECSKQCSSRDNVERSEERDVQKDQRSTTKPDKLAESGLRIPKGVLMSQTH